MWDWKIWKLSELKIAIFFIILFLVNTNIISYLVDQFIKFSYLWFIIRPKKLEMLTLYPIVDYFSPHYHDKYEELKNIQEIILAATMILRQAYFSQVSHLFWIVMLELYIPTQGLTKLQ